MKHTVYTNDDKHPRTIFTVECDTERLTACIKDKEITANDIFNCLKTAMEKVNAAIVKGHAKAKAEAEEA